LGGLSPLKGSQTSTGMRSPEAFSFSSLWLSLSPIETITPSFPHQCGLLVLLPIALTDGKVFLNYYLMIGWPPLRVPVFSFFPSEASNWKRLRPVLLIIPSQPCLLNLFSTSLAFFPLVHAPSSFADVPEGMIFFFCLSSPLFPPFLSRSQGITSVGLRATSRSLPPPANRPHLSRKHQFFFPARTSLFSSSSITPGC